MSGETPDSLVGHRFGEFELVERLGQGGMGAVYLAKDTSLDRMVAVKVMTGAVAADPDLVRRFAREAKAAARLNHPNIVQVYRAGNEGGTPYIAMEYVEGDPLDALLSRHGTLSWQQALRITEQVAAALACAHANGITHRDIKPGNIIVNQQGRAWVADFGLAKIQGTDTRLTATGLFMGSPRYMSPEQCGTAPVTPASDMFSLGIVLYEMLAGRRPFAAETPAGLVKQITLDDPEPLAIVAPAIPPAVRDLVARLMAKDPAERVADGAALAEAVREIGSGNATQSGRQRSSLRRLRWLAIPLVLLAFAAAGGLLRRWWAPAPTKREPEAVRSGGAVDFAMDVSERGQGVFVLQSRQVEVRLFPVDWVAGHRGILVAGGLGKSRGSVLSIGVIEPGTWKARILSRFNIPAQRLMERPHLYVPRVPDGSPLAGEFLLVHPEKGVLRGTSSRSASGSLAPLVPQNQKAAPLAAAVTPDGSRLCLALLDRPVRGGNVPARRPETRLVEYALDAVPATPAGPPVATVSGGVSMLRYTPDGSRLAYVRRLGNRRFEFCAVRLDGPGDGAVLVKTGFRNSGAFAFDPSGRSVVLSAVEDGSPEPVVRWMPMDGGPAASRLLGPGRIGESPWHPSGRYFVVMAPDDKGQDQMWKVTPDGTTRTCLTGFRDAPVSGRLLLPPSGPTVSSDGRWAVSPIAGGESDAIVFVDLSKPPGAAGGEG